MTIRRSYATCTDRELMEHVQSDDADAFGVLYDRLAPGALRVAGSVCLDVDRAQDATQDAFLSMWRSRAAYHADRGEVRSWAFGIVRNRSIDSLRRNARHDIHRSSIEGAAERVAAADDVQSDQLLGEAGRELRAHLAGVPEAQREVVALAYYGGLTHTEIAAQLDLPLGTVKGRMRLGLGAMRRQLAGDTLAAS